MECIAYVAVHMGVDVNSVVGGSGFEVFPRLNVWAYTFPAFGGTLALTSLLRWFVATDYSIEYVIEDAKKNKTSICLRNSSLIKFVYVKSLALHFKRFVYLK